MNSICSSKIRLSQKTNKCITQTISAAYTRYQKTGFSSEIKVLITAKKMVKINKDLNPQKGKL